MALIAALFAALGRVFGRVANLALGWATVLLFGQIPQSKQTLRLSGQRWLTRAATPGS
jgi:preprotein translocase subunit SecD